MQRSVSLAPDGDWITYGDAASPGSLGMETGQTTGATPKSTRARLPASNRGHARPTLSPTGREPLRTGRLGVQVTGLRDSPEERRGPLRDGVVPGP